MVSIYGPTYSKVQDLTEHTGYVLALAFSASGNNLVSGGVDTKIQIYEKEGAQFKHLITLSSHYNHISSLFFFKESLISGSTDKNINLYENFVHVHSITYDISVQTLTCNESVLVCGLLYGVIATFDNNLVKKTSWVAHKGWVKALAFAN